MVCADQVAAELSANPGGSPPGRPAAQTLRRSRFLTIMAARRRPGPLSAICALVLAFCVEVGVAVAQDTAAQEAAHRAELIAHLPHDAAKLVFGRETAPALGPAEAIGSYDRGCLEGAAALPADGPNWQVMRPSRNRAWGHPFLIDLLERLAQKL